MGKVFSAALAATALCGSAQAANLLQLTITKPVQAVTSAGGTLSFDATVTASSGNVGDVFLTGFGYSGSDPLVVNVDPALDNFPLSLAAGDSYSDLAFTVNVPTDSTPGTYVGFFYVQGGDVDGDQNTLAEQSFSVTINASAAPEPATWAMMVGGFGLVGASLRRRQRASLRFV